MVEQTHEPISHFDFGVRRIAERALLGLRKTPGRVGHRLRDLVEREREVPLRPAIDAERRAMLTDLGHTLSYYEGSKASGRPLVLLHSVNACASAYEMKPLFGRYDGQRPVYALDLGGFGFSERAARPYTAESYTAELIEFLIQVTKKGLGADIVALSLSAEFAARAAVGRKDLVHSLAFISPTGLGSLATSHKSPPLAMRDSEGALIEPWWAELAFEAIASRPSIAYFLSKSFVGPVDAGLKRYAYRTSHQLGARHAPLAFLSGRLFTKAIFSTYMSLERPVMVLRDRDAYARFDRLPELVERRSWWDVHVEPTLGMPQFERLNDTTKALDAFWSEDARPKLSVSSGGF